MNPAPIDPLLERLRLTPQHAAPDLRQEVRAAIHRRQAAPPRRSLFQWADLLRQPWIAAGGVAVALAIGSLPGALNHLRAQSETEPAYARRSLHLDVFAPIVLVPGNPATIRLSPR